MRPGRIWHAAASQPPAGAINWLSRRPLAEYSTHLRTLWPVRSPSSQRRHLSNCPPTRRRWPTYAWCPPPMLLRIMRLMTLRSTSTSPRRWRSRRRRRSKCCHRQRPPRICHRCDGRPSGLRPRVPSPHPPTSAGVGMMTRTPSPPPAVVIMILPMITTITLVGLEAPHRRFPR